MAVETLFNFNLSLPQAADISISVQGAHIYASTSSNIGWNWTLSLDGTTIKSVGDGAGGTTTLNPVMIGGRKGVPGGTPASPRSVPVVVQWYGGTNLKITGIDIVVNIRYR